MGGTGFRWRIGETYYATVFHKNDLSIGYERIPIKASDIEKEYLLTILENNAQYTK